MYRRNLLEVWQERQKRLEIVVPDDHSSQWHVTKTESWILGTFYGQGVRRWSLETGEELLPYQTDLIRPEQMPSPEMIANSLFLSTEKGTI